MALETADPLRKPQSMETMLQDAIDGTADYGIFEQTFKNFLSQLLSTSYWSVSGLFKKSY